MTKNEVMKEFLKKTILPIVAALLLFSIFSRIFTKNGSIDFFLVWLACGVPFGIGKMFTLIPIGFGISGTVGVVALNIVLSGLIGGVILIWKLAVAVWYLPLTVYRLFAKKQKLEGLIMSRKLVAYFSASGVTAKVAETLAEAIGADIYEIEPEIPYTKADLNWMDKKSRSTIEMNDPASRPAIRAKRDNMEDYDTVFVGFPIWWYVAPTIINTFLESYDLTGKTIVPFATSGGSGIGKTNEKLLPSCAGAKLIEGKVFKGNVSKAEMSAWVDGLKL